MGPFGSIADVGSPMCGDLVKSLFRWPYEWHTETETKEKDEGEGVETQRHKTSTVKGKTDRDGRRETRPERL